MSTGEKQKSVKFFMISALALAIVCAAVILILIFALQPKHKAYYNERFAECMQENKDKYNILMIQKTGDTSYCSQIKQPEKTDLCSSAGKDISVCTSLSEPEKSVCLAVLQKNPSACPKQDYWCMALASGDERYCLQIQNTELKKDCVIHTTLNADAFISKEAEQACKDLAQIYAVGMTGNKELCNRIANADLREQCIN